MSAERISAESGASALIVQSDAGRLPLADSTVDIVITSPPYLGLRSYACADQIGAEASVADYLTALLACTAEWLRVLKPSGSIFVNLGDKYVSDSRGSGIDSKRGTSKHAPVGPQGFLGRDVARKKSLIGLPWRYALACITDLDLLLRAEIIWAKPNGMPEPTAHDRARRNHETWFHFTASTDYFSVDTRPELHRDGSVWPIPTVPLRVPAALGVKHPAAFPVEWPRRFIEAWCPPAGVVLDPFGGSGTTALAARQAGRLGISGDLSHDYSRLAAWRCADAQPQRITEAVA